MFNLTRIGSSALQQGPITDMLGIQGKLGEVQRQISSGVEFNNFADLTAQQKTTYVLDLKHQVRGVEDFLHGNTLIGTRLDTMNTATSTIIDVSADVIGLITQRNNPATGTALPVQELADSFLSTIQGSLNAQLEGRYVFSGSRTNTPAVSNITESNVAYNAESNLYEANQQYYQGDDVHLQAYVSEEQSITYGVTANHPAFQKLIAAVHMLKKGDLTDNETMLMQANDLANEAMKELTSVQAGINSNRTIINANNEDHQDYKVFLKNAKDDAIGTDIGEASLNLANYQANLQAMFLAVSRIGSLKLSDFLS